MPEGSDLYPSFISLPPYSQSILAAGASNDIIFYIMAQKDRPGSEGDDNWTVLEFFEHGFGSGCQISPGTVGSFPLDGKVGPTDIYVDSLALSSSKVLFAVTVTEGKYDEEVFFYHGYLIESSAMKSKATRVFRMPYDGANVIPSIAHACGSVFVVIGGLVSELDSTNFQLEKTVRWPDDSVKYPSFAAHETSLFALPQINNPDTAVTKLLSFDLETSTHAWDDIVPDSRFGSPKVQWHKSFGNFVQVGNRLLAVIKGIIWCLDLSEKPYRWAELCSGRALHDKLGDTDFLFGASNGKLFLLGQEYVPKRLYSLEEP